MARNNIKYPYGDFSKNSNKVTRKIMECGEHKIELLGFYHYLMFAGQKNDYTDAYYAKIFNVSRRTVSRWKKELIGLGVLYVEKHTYTHYTNHVSDGSCTAEEYMNKCKEKVNAN